jgi:hypothetical protein
MTIETWFKKGARFKWKAPSALTPAQDGSIVASPATASTMTFDAADGRVITKIDTAGWLGFNRNAVVPHTWLCYILGRTAYTPLNTDVLTGFMSGCLIVQYTEAGQRYVAHVGTVETAAKNQPPNSTVKSTFLAKIAGLSAGEQMQVKGYNPANAWDYSEILPLQNLFKNGDAKILSLTTTGGQFFSILMIKAIAEPNVWVACGCKPIPGMGVNMLTTALS